MADRTRTLNLKVFQRLLRYNFKNRNLLDQALTHRSYAFEHPMERAIDNERMEFLGDAVLGLAISDHIYRQFPDCQEGEMTRIRSMLVGRVTLEDLARRVALGSLLLLGKGEAAGGGANQPSNIAGAYEAIIGAIYLDGGFKKADRFIGSQFKDEIKKVYAIGAKKDYKSILQEYTLKKYKMPPRYAVIFEEGPDHRKLFEVAVSFGGVIRGKGEGKNKKSAEQDAAREALASAGLLDKS